MDPDEPAILFFSSGTTGLPKAICLSSTNILFCTASVDFKLNNNGLLHFTSLYWMSGIFITILSFFGGCYRIITRKFDGEDTFRIIEKYKVVHAFITPLHTYTLTSCKNATKYDTSSLELVLISGGPISPTQLQKTREILKYSRVTACYGQTEIGYISFFSLDNYEQFKDTKLTSCGKPVPGLAAKIVDTNTGELLPPYQKGEICCKSPGLMLGYYNTDASHVFDEDNFIKTGDVGYYDEDEFIYVVDRIKEMFKYQSWHIVPSVIEGVLLEHPAIAEACVYGIPHEIDGEIPAASVVLKSGIMVTSKEIAEFVAEKVLNREKLRAGITIVEHLPKTPTGKLIRREARDQALRIVGKLAIMESGC